MWKSREIREQRSSKALHSTNVECSHANHGHGLLLAKHAFAGQVLLRGMLPKGI